MMGHFIKHIGIKKKHTFAKMELVSIQYQSIPEFTSHREIRFNDKGCIKFQFIFLFKNHLIYLTMWFSYHPIEVNN